jgi:hypothetical protein
MQSVVPEYLNDQEDREGDEEQHLGDRAKGRRMPVKPITTFSTTCDLALRREFVEVLRSDGALEMRRG